MKANKLNNISDFLLECAIEHIKSKNYDKAAHQIIIIVTELNDDINNDYILDYCLKGLSPSKESSLVSKIVDEIDWVESDIDENIRYPSKLLFFIIDLLIRLINKRSQANTKDIFKRYNTLINKLYSIRSDLIECFLDKINHDITTIRVSLNNIKNKLKEYNFVNFMEKNETKELHREIGVAKDDSRKLASNYSKLKLLISESAKPIPPTNSINQKHTTGDYKGKFGTMDKKNVSEITIIDFSGKTVKECTSPIMDSLSIDSSGDHVAIANALFSCDNKFVLSKDKWIEAEGYDSKLNKIDNELGCSDEMIEQFEEIISKLKD